MVQVKRNMHHYFIEAFVQVECNSQVKSWFSRVPSHSNPADGVSRLSCDLPLSLGAEQTTVEWESFRCLVDQRGEVREAPDDTPIAGRKKNERTIN